MQDGNGKIIGQDYADSDGICFMDIKKDVGNYKATVCIDKPNTINAKPFVINLKISKAPVKITVKKLTSDTKSYATLKAIVKDRDDCSVDGGTVKFTINGKSYKAKVDSGVAVKKIKLSKAKTYTYKATFSSKNYKSKAASSKVVVKKAKNYYIFKAGKYSAKLTYKQYKKLLNAKINKKDSHVKIKVGSYPYKSPNYKVVKVKKTKWVYKKVLSFKSVTSSDWSDTTYYDYPIDKYTKKGWKLYGWKDVDSNDGRVYKSYAKLKKKVTYTESKKVKSGYKTAYSPIYLYVETIAYDGQNLKGDYVKVWTLADYDIVKVLSIKKINLNNY